MFSPLPTTSEAFEALSWSEIEPWYHELLNCSLAVDTLDVWMAQWSDLSALLDETMYMRDIACTRDTADETLVQRKQRFLTEIYSPAQELDQQIKERLLASGLEPRGFAIPLRNLRAEASLYRAENLPLINEDKLLNDEYFRIGGEQKVVWEDKEVPLRMLTTVMKDPDRARRERAWRVVAARQLEDQDKLNTLWVKKMQLRQKIAQNAGFDNYRDYRWKQLLRFDYTPDDCKAFHKAFERVLIPAVSQLREKRRRLLGVETLRPWDMSVNLYSHEAPRAIADVAGFLRQFATLFHLIDPQLGQYFNIMLEEGLFDLETRQHKASAGYCMPLEVRHRPFVFGHVRSIANILSPVCHEAGHAFHLFEMAHLPYIHQRKMGALPMEFAEVASTTMELIGSLHLHRAGICSQQEAALLRIDRFEHILLSYLPIIIRADAFQHWVYDNLDLALDPQKCEEQWIALSRRFLPAIDWGGLDREQRNGWQQYLHFYCYPFYMIEYAYATLGAFQIWRNYLNDPQKALQQYRYGLSLGATRTIPELYEAAGAKFAFDDALLEMVQRLVEETIVELEG
ncbi:peptidase M3 [Ktedonosporobacter rubrisoli]|uniref:Peptidase M3 n=1 Tax=Ktedonosporobacter rubrisoli TaxID=2509675 RepID=A0A4P6K6B5_KTERU|nr:peptidase M3 [Ktedonosporobacter rubrisoli]